MCSRGLGKYFACCASPKSISRRRKRSCDLGKVLVTLVASLPGVVDESSHLHNPRALRLYPPRCPVWIPVVVWDASDHYWGLLQRPEVASHE